MKITRTAQKQLRKIDQKYAVRLLDALEEFEKNGSGDVKKLQGREGYRLRIGGYRAIFGIELGEVIVLEVGVRGDIY